MAFGYLSFHIFTKSFIKKTLTKEFYSSLNIGLTFARYVFPPSSLLMPLPAQFAGPKSLVMGAECFMCAVALICL